MKLRVVIPSLGRVKLAGRALRLFVNPMLCVAESEYHAYRAYYPRVDILVHPDQDGGLGKVRQRILNEVQEECVFMVDDDVYRLGCLVGQTPRTIKEPEAVMAIIENTAQVAKDLGTCLFGFAHMLNTRHFTSYHPFGFSGFINGFAMGIIGREFHFDPDLDTKQDIDFSLQVLHKKRILFRDKRFCFVMDGTFKHPGGNAMRRTTKTVERDVLRLKKKWGDAVEIDHFKRKGSARHQNVSVHVTR